MKRQFIMVLPKGFAKYNFEDLLSDSRAIVLENTFKNVHNKCLKTLQTIHLSSKINEKIDLPLKKIWGYSLDDIEWKKDIFYYIIFIDPFPLSPKYLIDLRKKYHIKYILYINFVWSGNSNFEIRQRNFAEMLKYDYIFSFDPKESKSNHFIYYPLPYSILKCDATDDVCNDLILTATGRKGRLKSFIEIFDFLNKKGLSLNWRITGVPKREQKFSDKIVYNKLVPYTSVVEFVNQSNCILEVLAKGQTGATLRYYEAVCYNKKLLTNNKNVVNLPFYNPDYIHVFEKPEDIDWNWVKERTPVDYHYDGRFSPTHLIDEIIKLEEEKEGKPSGPKQAF